MTEIEVTRLIEDLALTGKPLAKKEGNNLEISIEDDLGTMNSDLTKVNQILLNLLSNACKFTHEGNILLQARRERRDGADWLRFDVVDSGIGMSQEQLERIFDGFTQGDESTSRRYGGTGLGLTISREFCELLGGTIDVRSEEGKGSTFTVNLPAQAPGVS